MQDDVGSPSRGSKLAQVSEESTDGYEEEEESESVDKKGI